MAQAHPRARSGCPFRQCTGRGAGSTRPALAHVRRRLGTGLLALLVGSAAGVSAAAGDCPAPCWIAAAHRHGVNPQLLVAIARVESGLRANAVGHNRDGSVDLGLMQINSRWLPQLRAHGLEAADLMQPCVSVHVGAWILAQAMRRHGNTWTAVGAYHAGPGLHRDRYIARVRRALVEPSGTMSPGWTGPCSAMSSTDAERVPGSGALDASR